MTQKELRSGIRRKAGRYVWDAREWGGWARSFSVHDDLSGLSGGESDAVASALLRTCPPVCCSSSFIFPDMPVTASRWSRGCLIVCEESADLTTTTER